MAADESLGIKRMEALHYYVHDLDRSRRFYVDVMDFAEIGHSAPALEQEGRQRSVVFKAGECIVQCSQPLDPSSRAGRYLRKHPDGVGTIVFEVEEIERTFRLLEKRGGTFITDITRYEDDGGSMATFSITTPFGDTTFRFVERRGYSRLFPGLETSAPPASYNKYGFSHFDHVTSNFQTMAPALLWLEHVMGFERYWDIQFHTDDVAAQSDHGSGLKSRVMVDRPSGVKFANNEPYRPFFKASQINLFTEDHRGDGVQHVALAVPDILESVKGLRASGVEFMPTMPAYYAALPERLKKLGVGTIDEDIEVLKELQILVDGDHEHAYLLQIFMKDSASLYHDPAAGPFFFEIIQRKGDNGFGGGNFRALFESIETQQKLDKRV